MNWTATLQVVGVGLGTLAVILAAIVAATPWAEWCERHFTRDGAAFAVFISVPLTLFVLAFAVAVGVTA
jgi:hypothetical protein